MDEDVHARIERDRSEAMSEAGLLRTFRDYYRGRQKSTLTRDQQRMLRSLTGNRFCDNVCRRIVDAFINRLEFLRYAVEDTTVGDFLSDFFVMNQLSDLSYDAMRSTARDGNHALALKWVPDPARGGGGRVGVSRERWWDGKTGIFVAYGEDDVPAYAVKDWVMRIGANRIDRRVIWFPDHIERYARNGEGWRPYPLAGEPADTGIVPWLKRDGSPLHLPIVHLPNGSDDDSPYGISELDGGVLGFQDEINDIQRDVTATSRLTGYQMYTATGTISKDSNGNLIALEVGPGQTLQTDNADARYGVLPAGDLSQLERAYLLKLKAVCGMTDTPIHMITNDWPSGEALIRAEMPLVSKVRNRAKTIGPTLATLAHRATEMANTFGDGAPLDEDALIVAVFAPPEQLDALTLAKVAAVEAEFVSNRETLRTLGRSPQDIKRIEQEREEDMRRAMEAGVGL